MSRVSVWTLVARPQPSGWGRALFVKSAPHGELPIEQGGMKKLLERLIGRRSALVEPSPELADLRIANQAMTQRCARQRAQLEQDRDLRVAQDAAIQRLKSDNKRLVADWESMRSRMRDGACAERRYSDELDALRVEYNELSSAYEQCSGAIHAMLKSHRRADAQRGLMRCPECGAHEHVTDSKLFPGMGVCMNPQHDRVFITPQGLPLTERQASAWLAASKPDELPNTPAPRRTI